jgi:phage FluMu protein Com
MQADEYQHRGTKSRPAKTKLSSEPKRQKPVDSIRQLQEKVKEQEARLEEYSSLQMKFTKLQMEFEEIRAVNEKERMTREKELVRLQENVTCCLCMESMFSSGRIPARICSNGHYICAAPCLNDLFNNKSVKLQFDLETNLPKFQHFEDSLAVKCPHCDVSVTILSIRQMIDHFIYQCFWDKEETCPYKGCVESHAGRGFVRHVLSCPFLTVNCQHCNEVVLHADLEEHIQRQCAQLSCRFCEADTMTYRFEALKAHLIVHSRHRDLRYSLRCNLTEVTHLIQDSPQFATLCSDNVPINHAVLQEALHFNGVLNQFLSRFAAGTFDACWNPGEERDEQFLLTDIHGAFFLFVAALYLNLWTASPSFHFEWPEPAGDGKSYIFVCASFT